MSRNTNITWYEGEQNVREDVSKQYLVSSAINEGGHNSNVSDVCVTLTNGKEIYVEVKTGTPREAGQFTPKFNKKTNKWNLGKNNVVYQPVIDYLNANSIYYYETLTSSGMDLDVEEAIVSNCIKDHYNQKNVSIVANGETLQYCLLSEVEKYWNLSVSLRSKPSGTSNCPKKYDDAVINYLNDNYGLNAYRDGKTLFVENSEVINGTVFNVENASFVVKKDSENNLRVRKLSNRANATVVFHMQPKEDVEYKELDEILNSVY